MPFLKKNVLVTVHNFQPSHKGNSIIFILSYDLTFLHLEKSHMFFSGMWSWRNSSSCSLLFLHQASNLKLSRILFVCPPVIYEKEKGYYSGEHCYLRSKECALELEDPHMNKLIFFSSNLLLTGQSDWKLVNLFGNCYSFKLTLFLAIHFYLTLS